MPPAAISRSSTYLPKICGNTELHHTRSAGFVMLAGLALAACGEASEIPPFRLSAHGLPACAPPADSRLRLTALGDFSATETTSEDLALGAASDLVIPAETLAFEALLEADGRRFRGYAERAADGSAELLLWPEAVVCALRRARVYPTLGGGQGVGYDPEQGTLLLAGGRSTESPSANAGILGFDSGSGRLSDEDADEGLYEPRAFPSITPFGGRLLIAGGENPTHDLEAPAPRKTAEVYDPSSGRFEDTRIELVEERARHAAVTLESGSTLLVGGRGAIGDALRVLELVNPERRNASIVGLAALRAARIAPSVLVLEDGRLFVGGGVAADGTPLSVLEWLSPDARAHLGAVVPPDMPARYGRAFAALPGGGVLAVGGCEQREPRDTDEAGHCAEQCQSGCPPLSGYDAWWVLPDGELRELDLEIEAPRPVLLGGRDGRPLFAGGKPGDRRLFRFDPWHAAFELLPLESQRPPRGGLPALAIDVEAFVWVAEGGGEVTLEGLRLGTRNRYSRDVFLVAQADPEVPDRPLNLVVDRPLDAATRYDGALAFTPESEVTVYVAATDYADLDLELHFEGAAPRVVLGDTELGGVDCPWPGDDTPESRVRLERRGPTVSLIAASARSDCSLGAGRLRLGFRSSHQAETRLTRVDAIRSGR